MKKVFREKDDRAKALLVTFIADSHLEYVRDKPTAKIMWESLSNTFSKKGFASQTYIRRSLALLRMDEGTALADHFRRFDELVRQLKDAGATLTELDQVSQLFISLPASYDVVTTAMENLADDQIKLGMVKARLLAEERKRFGRDGSAMNNSEDGPKFSGKCFGCGSFGHKRAACSKARNYARAQAAEIPVDREVALVSPEELNKSTRYKVEWILDSGASRHMANSDKLFSSIVELTNPVTIDSAKNAECMEALKEGIVKGRVVTESGRLSLKITKVLYVPNLRFNLLSVAALLKVGVHVEFLQDRAVLSKFGNIIGEAMMRGKLFYLTMDVETASALTAGPGEISNVEGWQRRYAQPRY